MPKTTVIKDKLFQLVFLLFGSVVMLDPTNKLFHIKEIVFVLLLFFTVVLHKGYIYKEVLVPYVTLLALAALSICSGVVFGGGDLSGALSYFKALAFGVVFYALASFSPIEIIKFNYWIGLGLSLFIVLMLLSYAGGLLDLSGLIGKLIETQTIMVARRDLFGINVLMFFYKTMPFCFFSLIYALRNKRYVAAAIILVAIAFGGSRTPMLVALSIVLYLLYDRKSKYLRLALGLICISLIVFLIFKLTSGPNIQSGDELKKGVATYLLGKTSLLGHGAGATYWNPERGEFVTSSEVTYFEMMYQYGLVLFPFVLFVFINPLFILFQRRNNVEVKDFAVAYFFYLVNAGTNPLLINSTGMYVFSCALTIAAKIKKSKGNLHLREV